MERVIIYLLLAVYGVGPLWVAQVLFLCSCVLLLLRKFDKKEKVYEFCGNMNLPVLLSMFLIIWILAVFLNVNESIHALYIYKIGTCLGTFLLGYYIISHERIQELLKKHFLLLSILAAVSTVLLLLYVLLVLYILVSSLKMPVFLAQLLLLILTFGCSFVLYQLFRRIPVIRYCMFGFRKQNKEKNNKPGL